MKKLLLITSIFAAFCLISCNKNSLYNNEITVYCYDSFIGDWGPGEAIAKEFEEDTGIHVNLISASGASQLYSKVLLEGDECQADVVIGLSDMMPIDLNLFESWKPECIKSLIRGNLDNLIPFDYGILSFIYDTTQELPEIPTCLEDLTKANFKNKLILVDPRTSSVGLGLLFWTIRIFGQDAFTWWNKVNENALTIADSWSSAYGLFTQKEAPLVISYSTSPVYHMMNENSYDYDALQFTDGHLKITEYLGIPKTSKKKENAEKFCEFILTKGQCHIATANTMYPANTETILPEEYKNLNIPALIDFDYAEEMIHLDSYLNLWTEYITK